MPYENNLKLLGEHSYMIQKNMKSNTIENKLWDNQGLDIVLVHSWQGLQSCNLKQLNSVSNVNGPCFSPLSTDQNSCWLAA